MFPALKERRMSENELRKKDKEIRKLKLLLETGGYVNSSLSLDTVLNRALQAAENVMEAERSSIWQVDKNGKELFFRILRGGDASVLKNLRLKMGEGIAGTVAKEGKPMIVKDVKKDPHWAHRFDDKSDFETRSILSVPLSVRGQTIGVMQLLNKKGGRNFNDNDLHELMLLAGQVSIAIDNARLYEQQKEIFLETAIALATAVEKRDEYTGGHTRRVVEYSVAIGRRLDLTEEQFENIRVSAVLHDIGKIGIPDAILNKPGSLNDEEQKIMMSHTAIGGEIIAPIEELEEARSGIVFHHEKWDGSGYLYGIKGEKIPLLARIISVADTYDAMTTDRPYRKGMSPEIALNEILSKSGTQFCPSVVTAFWEAFQSGEIKKIGTKIKSDFPGKEK